MSTSSITELAKGKVYALHNTFPIDGRVSAYPSDARGHAASNCYLLKQDDGALMLDTGYAAHEPQILEQLASILDPKTPLSLFPLRINEFMSVCNAMAIARHFNVVQCYSPVPEVELWLEFEKVEVGRGKPTLKTTLLERGLKKLQVGNSGTRKIDVFNAPIRLINTTWIYDWNTKTLFSSDQFTHVWRDTEKGPWLFEGDDDGVTTSAFVRSFLLNTRYWWLEGARVEPLRAAVAEALGRYDIETIAPGYGVILRGRDLVKKQFAVLDDVLRNLDRSRAKAAYVTRDLMR